MKVKVNNINNFTFISENESDTAILYHLFDTSEMKENQWENRKAKIELYKNEENNEFKLILMF